MTSEFRNLTAFTSAVMMAMGTSPAFAQEKSSESGWEASSTPSYRGESSLSTCFARAENPLTSAAPKADLASQSIRSVAERSRTITDRRVADSQGAIIENCTSRGLPLMPTGRNRGSMTAAQSIVVTMPLLGRSAFASARA